MKTTSLPIKINSIEEEKKERFN